MTYQNHAAFAARHKSFLAGTTRADLIKTCDTFLVIGQSNAGATFTNTTDVVVTETDVAWTILREPQPRRTLQGPLQNGASNSTFIGQSAPWPAFAQEWYDLTGRRSVWSNVAFAGTPLHPEGLPDNSRHWATTPYATSMCGGSEAGEEKPGEEILDDAVQTRALYPKLAEGMTFGVWVGGEADGPRLYNGFLTQQEFEDEFNLLIDKFKSRWGMDYMLVYGMGREGTDSAEVDTKETTEGMAAVRQAQINVCNDRSDTLLILNAAKEKGSPFNTLSVDGNGRWSAGWSYQADGVHYLPESYKTMGVTGAWNTAVHLGLQEGSLIGAST